MCVRPQVARAAAPETEIHDAGLRPSSYYLLSNRYISADVDGDCDRITGDVPQKHGQFVLHLLEHVVADAATETASLPAIAEVGGPPRVRRTPGARNQSIVGDVRLHSPSRVGSSGMDVLLEQVMQ